MRRAVTPDLDTGEADFVQFTVQLGGKDARTACFDAERREESLLLMYSNNAGITWILIKEMQALDYTIPR